jgi:hypothetical protein
MSAREPAEREIHLLALVAKGNGNSDARRIDLDMYRRFGGIGSTILNELVALREAGYVSQDVSRGGLGGRWAVTLDALPYLPGQG